MLFHLHLRKHHRKPHTRSYDLSLAIFHVGLWWKILYGTFKASLGVILFYFVGLSFGELFTMFFDPSSYNTLFPVLQISFIEEVLGALGALPVTYFIAYYFLFWGTVEVFLSGSLLLRHLWAFPVSMIAISFFTLYQVLRFISTQSHMLIVSVIIDLCIVGILYIEYKKEKVLYGLK